MVSDDMIAPCTNEGSNFRNPAPVREPIAEYGLPWRWCLAIVLATALACWATDSRAIGTTAAFIAARGSVHATRTQEEEPATPRPRGVCVFVVPGRLEAINLAAVDRIALTIDREISFSIGRSIYKYPVTNGDSDGSFKYVIDQWKACQ